MSLKEADRKALVILGMEKSDKMVDEVRHLIGYSMWSLAANRLYYALFHAVTAMLISDNHPVGTHRGAINNFSLYYVKTGIFTREEGKLYSQLQQLRDDGDYNCAVDVDRDDVEPKIAPTLSLIEKIRKRVSNSK